MNRIKKWIHRITDDGPDNIDSFRAVELITGSDRPTRLARERLNTRVVWIDVVNCWIYLCIAGTKRRIRRILFRLKYR